MIMMLDRRMVVLLRIVDQTHSVTWDSCFKIMSCIQIWLKLIGFQEILRHLSLILVINTDLWI